MQIAPAVQVVLSGAAVSASAVTLPPGQLDRKLYIDIDKVLRAMGGRWDRLSRSHLFDEEDPAEAMDRALSTGAVISRKSEFGAFYTPPSLAADVIARADLHAGMMVLEPSAGRGALAAPALLVDCEVHCVEIDARSVGILCSTAYASVVQADFLTQRVAPAFDRVVMNPPFARQADIHHVSHAFRFLKPGGRLVAIMSAGVQHRADRRATEFRDFVRQHGGTMEALPAESFKTAGTCVATCLVILRKAA